MQAELPRKFSGIRTRLAMVVLACVIPAAIGFALLIDHFYDREKAQIKRDTLLTARALALAVDRDLNSGKIAALALATSRSIGTKDLAVFHAQAKSLLSDEFPGFAFVLSDASGQQVVNTLRPYGEALPHHGNPEQLRRVFATGKPAVSDVYLGAISHQPLVSIDVPVWRDGQVVYDLSVGFLPERLGKILSEQRLPPDRIVGILDRQGVIVARTHEAKRFVGQKAAPLLLERMKDSDEGDFDTTSKEGIPLYSMYSRSVASGWTVAIGVPRQVVFAELQRSIAWLMVVVAALLLAGFAAAWVLGGKISESVRSLTAAAKDLGSGLPRDRVPAFFREADDMATTLDEVEAELMQHRHHLEDLVAETTRSLQVAQQEGLQREKFTNAIFEGTPETLLLVDATGQIVRVNQAALNIFGYPAERMLELHVDALVSSSASPILAALRDGIAHDTVQRSADIAGDLLGRRADGSDFPVEVALSPIQFEASQFVIVLLVDISARRLAERALANAGAELQTIIDHMPSLVVYWDARLINRFANRGYVDWFGFTPQQLRGKHISEVIGEDRYRQIEPMLQSVLQGNSEVFERSVELVDGSRRQALFSYVPDVVDGTVNGLYGIITDISALKQAQRDKSHALEQLQSVIDAATEFSIIATAPDGVITLFSRGAEKMLGYTAIEVVNNKSLTLVHSEDEVGARGVALSREYGTAVAGADVLLEPARRGQTAEREWTYVRKNGSQLPVSLSVTAMRNTLGEINGFLGVAKDIAQDRAARQALADARDQANAANVAKSQFLANMSHEIRTPMNAILGMLQLLLRTELNTQQHDYVGKTRNAAKSLLDILNDILDFSKVEAGKMELERHAFGFTPLLNDVCAIVEGNLGARKVTVRVSRDANLPEWVHGDDLRLRQVLLNLTGNAIKFTEQGEIVLSLRVVSQDSACSVVEFSVQDSGIGIAPEHLRHIFEGFSQAEASTTRRFGGTGLGLAICKRLVGLMGGDLQVHSSPGQGSCFLFLVKFEHAQAPAAASGDADPMQDRRQPVRGRSASQQPGARLAGLRLLIVEDNPINQLVARELLKAEGAVVEVANGGIPGVERVLAADPPFDAVLMDIQMPDMDGYTATRKIRAHKGRTGMQTLPIIAMTANAMPSDRLACLEAGMNEHIGKPFDLNVLVQTLQRLCATP